MRAFYLVAAIVLALATSLIVAIDTQSGMATDRDSLELYRFGIGTMLVAWLITEPKLPTADRPTLGHGLLHLLFFPLLAFYQQFVVRRRWGIAIVCGIILILLTPTLVQWLILVTR